MSIVQRSLLAAAITLVTAQVAHSQTILERWYGDFSTQFGRRVSAAGDVDGDGTRDVLITSTDRVEVYSGATHALVHAFSAPVAGVQFGYSIDASGDVDNDGYSDVLIGAPYNDFLGIDSGSAWIYSGRTGQVIRLYHGLVPQDRTGWHVGFVGDIDGDLHDDFALSTPYAAGSGQVRIYSGASGVLASVLETFAPDAGFGQSFEPVGDLDGDGLAELAVLERPIGCCTQVSALHVYSLPTVNELFVIDAPGAGSFANAGDVDGDAIDDIVVTGAAVASNSPFFELFSGADGSLVAPSQETFGICCHGTTAVSGVADLDGDGLAQEFVFTYADGGLVYAYRGTQQIAWLYPVGPVVPAYFGTAAAVMPDTNADGFDEVLIGSPGSATVLPQVWLMSAFALPAQSYCTAKVNSLGCTPVIGATGTADLNGPYAFVPEARNVINQKAGLFVWSSGSQAIPFKGGTLCVVAPLRRSIALNSGGSATGSDCTGRLLFNMTPMFMWLEGWQVGDEFFGQFWYRDPAHIDGTNVGLSDGLRFRVGL